MQKKEVKKGYVVSGHAAQTLYNTFNTAGGVNIGYVSDTAFIDNSSADAAFISSSIYAETSNYLNVYVCTGVIEEVGDMPIGTTVYMYGGISGERKSGTIVSHYYTSKRKNIYGDVINLLRQTTTTYEGVNGDSGSPVFILTGSSLVDALLVGIHSGHMETSEGYAIFSRYSNIVDELGVTAITK